MGLPDRADDTSSSPESPIVPTPSYHDLHITTAEVKRTSIFNLPYGYEIHCTRVTGWLLYDNGARLSPHLAQPHPHVVAGEYEGPDEWLVLDVAGHVILDSRRAVTGSEADAAGADDVSTSDDAQIRPPEDHP